MSKNYYEILELNNYADETEIKKSYRRLALKWHPDKNPNNIEMATEKFNEISEAFEVLGDKQKRKQYDIFGNINSNQTPKQNPQDVFNHFFNDINQDTFFENILNSKMNSLNINNVNVRTNINTNTNFDRSFNPIFNPNFNSSFTNQSVSTQTFINGNKMVTRKVVRFQDEQGNIQEQVEESIDDLNNNSNKNTSVNTHNFSIRF